MKAYYRETENSIFKNLLWLHCYGAGVDGDWSYIEQDDQGSRPRHNTVSQKLDKLQLPGWARLEFPGRSSTVTTHFAAHTRQAQRCNPQLRSRRDPRWTLLLFYYNILTATVTFIDWCIYLMIIRRGYLFAFQTKHHQIFMSNQLYCNTFYFYDAPSCQTRIQGGAWTRWRLDDILRRFRSLGPPGAGAATPLLMLDDVWQLRVMTGFSSPQVLIEFLELDKVCFKGGQSSSMHWWCWE